LGLRAHVGEELGTLREVSARLAYGGTTEGIRAAQPHGGTVGKGVEHDEHASGKEEQEALCR